MSITINKKNIDARNLLGLVYCEMGDVVEALSEWVISKNIQPDNNCAEDYITDIQSNQNKFELVTSTIKKYNLSLRYAKEGNTDMAQIQLKKVVSQNPRLLKAQQLLKTYGNKRRSLTIKGAFGDTSIRGGSIIYINFGDIGDIAVDEKMSVERVLHTFESGVHKMTLELRGGLIND